MPTTTNFGWTTPADTDLVKDGAAAIRTLGNGIDTSFLDLKGGTTGQTLQKASNTDLDFSWVTVSASGGYTLLSTVNASAATGVQFATISGSYKHLFVTWDNVYFDSTGDKYLYMRLNNDSTSNYGTTVTCNAAGYDCSHTNTTSTPLNQYRAIILSGHNSTNPLNNCYGYMWIYDYTNTTRTNFTWDSASFDNGTTAKHSFGNGVYDNTAAITQIDFIRNTTQTITGTFKLYGVN